MTQENKKLLLKDICARIPYGLKASVRGSIEENITFDILSVATNFKVFVENRFISVSHYEDIEVVRPYLRPLTSLTKEEKEYVEELSNFRATPDIVQAKVDFYMEHYINYRLPDNLFIEATEGMYNIKN